MTPTEIYDATTFALWFGAYIGFIFGVVVSGAVVLVVGAIHVRRKVFVHA